jgi:hypothetical protein
MYRYMVEHGLQIVHFNDVSSKVNKHALKRFFAGLLRVKAKQFK